MILQTLNFASNVHCFLIISHQAAHYPMKCPKIILKLPGRNKNRHNDIVNGSINVIDHTHTPAFKKYNIQWKAAAV